MALIRGPSYSDSEQQQQSDTLMIKNKPVIGLKDWLHNFKPSNSQVLKEHIMSFFLAEGLYDVAKSFSQETGLTMPAVDEVKIKQRYEIKNMIRKGQIDEAIQKISSIDPTFNTCQKTNQLIFSLQCLKVINMIKQGNLQGSIQTARLQLLPFTKKGEKYIKQTQKIMGLLAFMNLQDCPNKDLVKEQHALKVAGKINRYLLNSVEDSNQHSLEALLKLGKWCQKRLAQFIDFPVICLDAETQIFGK